MRVLLVNAFFYPRGGVERAVIDESRWLSAAGHEVAHFAIQDPRNLASPTARWFAPPADYSETASFASQLALLPDAIWSRPAADAMTRLLGAWRPDVAHIHAPSRYLTPSPLRSLEQANVPMVMTLHDFKPWCTNRTLFAHGKPCVRCRGGAHWNALATGCVQDSPAKSAVGAVEAYVHDAIGAYRGIRRWIAPSRFARDQAVWLGLDATRVRVVTHGMEPVPVPGEASGVAPSSGGVSGAAVAPGSGTATAPGSGAGAVASPRLPDVPFAFYAGRLSDEKGVRLLPEIGKLLAPAPLIVAGEGPLGAWLVEQRARVPSMLPIGHLDRGTLDKVTARASVVLVPSLSYETFCFAAAEALLAARPVVASRIGAIPELIEHEVTGLLAPPGDAAAFAALVLRALNDPAARAWAGAGRARVLERTDPARHVRELLAVFAEAGATGSGPGGVVAPARPELPNGN